MFENRGGRTRGFTLIELMIVVAILAIVSAIAIPNLLKARAAANEASAIASLRTVVSVNERYKLRFQTFANTLASLVASGLIDESLGSGTKAGYTFDYEGSQQTFRCNADPQTPGTSGDLYFYVNTSGVIRFSSTGSATSSSEPIGK